MTKKPKKSLKKRLKRLEAEVAELNATLGEDYPLMNEAIEMIGRAVADLHRKLSLNASDDRREVVETRDEAPSDDEASQRVPTMRDWGQLTRDEHAIARFTQRRAAADKAIHDLGPTEGLQPPPSDGSGDVLPPNRTVNGRPRTNATQVLIEQWGGEFERREYGGPPTQLVRMDDPPRTGAHAARPPQPLGNRSPISHGFEDPRHYPPQGITTDRYGDT